MQPGEMFIVVLSISLSIFAIMFIAGRYFRLREKKLEVEAIMVAGKAAHEASGTKELEGRVRVLEQIVTDGGLHTAAQIEALRAPRLRLEEKV